MVVGVDDQDVLSLAVRAPFAQGEQGLEGEFHLLVAQSEFPGWWAVDDKQ